MKIIDKVDKIWDWLVWSSANPNQLSLTVKGMLTGIVTLITVGLGVAHIPLPGGATALLSQIVDATVTAVQAIAGAVSAIAVVVGIIRKLVETVKGTHWVFTE